MNNRIYENTMRILERIGRALVGITKILIIMFMIAVGLVVIRYTIPAIEMGMPKFTQFVDEILIPNGDTLFGNIMNFLRK